MLQGILIALLTSLNWIILILELKNAATKIQSTFRGHKTRKEMDNKKEDVEETQKQLQDLSVKVTKMRCSKHKKNFGQTYLYYYEFFSVIWQWQ